MQKMPTNASVEMRFKQITKTLDDMMIKMQRTFVSKGDHKEDLEKLKEATHKIYVTQKDFKTNWSNMQK